MGKKDQERQNAAAEVENSRRSIRDLLRAGKEVTNADMERARDAEKAWEEKRKK